MDAMMAILSRSGYNSRTKKRWSSNTDHHRKGYAHIRLYARKRPLSGITSMGGDPYLVGVLPLRESRSLPKACVPMRESLFLPLITLIRITASRSSVEMVTSFPMAGRGDRKLILEGNLPQKVPPCHQMGRPSVSTTSLVATLYSSRTPSLASYPWRG